MGEQIVCSNCLSNADSGLPACPYCGQSFENTNPAGTLPVNTLLAGRYTIGRVLALDGEDSPFAASAAFMENTDTPAGEWAAKLLILHDKVDDTTTNAEEDTNS